MTQTDTLQFRLILITIIIPVTILLLSYFLSKKNNITFQPRYTLGFIIGGTFMVFGYYIAAYYMYGSYITPIFSLPWNIVQFVAGMVIAEIILIGLRRGKVVR